MSVDDSRLIASSLQGDRNAFGELVYRYQNRVYNTVFRLLGNAEDAYDVVQETFLNAYLSLENFKGDAQFFTWLYRIAINTAISHRRKQRPNRSLDAGRNGEGKIDPLDTSEASMPERALEREEDENQVRRALNRLSPEHRTVLVLKEIEGQKYEAMAEVLGVPIGTIRSRLHRARLELRDLLEQDERREGLPHPDSPQEVPESKNT